MASMLALMGCQNLNPVSDTALYFFTPGNASKHVAYVPGFEYLELDWDGHKAFLALGYRSVNTFSVVEHWYSAQGEMLSLRNGRIVEALGTTHEVRNKSSNEPSWADLIARKSPMVWIGVKDVMPGYRYGLKEHAISQNVIPTNSERQLLKVEAEWVLEEVKSKTPSGEVWIYQQKFAIANDKVIYSEQCISPQVCFKLRPLGVVVSRP